MSAPLRLAVLALLAGAATASADTLTVNVRDANGGAALPATAAAVATDGTSSGGATAGGSGQAAITGLDPTKTYTVTASLPGYAVKRAAGLTTGSIATLDLTRSANRFTALPVFGGANGGRYADGQPGVFYVQSTQIPQLYRTTDWGGSWAPVTIGTDDPAEGLPGTFNIGRDISVTTSRFPGEVAAYVAGAIYASRDFGISWKKVAGPGVAPFPQLFWAHAGTTSVLLYTSGDHQYVADMTAATPTFAQMTTDWARAADGAAFGVGNGQDKPYIAVADSGGTVRVYELTAALAPGSPVDTIAGFVTGPSKLVAVGGKADPAGPPFGIAVASDTQLGMSVKGAAADPYPAPVQAASTQCVGPQPGPSSGLTPDSGTTAGVGMASLNSCWLSLTGGALTVSPSVGGAIDAGFGQDFGGTTSRVVFSGARRGPVKSATLSSGAPVFDPSIEAAAGTAPTSGGVSVVGITAPTVTGQVFGPSAPAQQATVLHGGFGGVGYASTDGGQSVKVASGVGGWSVDWFTGASGSWLVFGTPAESSGNVLTAFKDWTTATPKAVAANLDGARRDDNSLLMDGTDMVKAQAFATAMVGAPGTDLLFAGFSDGNGFDSSSHGVVRRLKLNESGGVVSASEITAIGVGQITKSIQAMAYCPAAGSADSVKDVLLVATGSGLWRVTGATGGAPSVTQVASVTAGAFVNDVAIHCASGTAWAGTRNGGSSLFRSTNGGAAFAGVTLPKQGFVETVGLNQADASTVLVGIGVEGLVLSTINGGTSWVVQNDPATEHNFAGDGIADLLVPPPTTAARAIRSGARFSPRAFSGLSGNDMVLAGAGVYAAQRKSAPAPGPGGGGTTKPPPAKDTSKPVLSKIVMTYRRFAVDTKFTAISAAKKAHRGTTFSFTVTERSTVSIAVQRAKTGYKKGKRCVAKRPKGKKPGRCLIYKTAGTLVRKDVAGTKKVPFSGRLGKTKLAAGKYRARVTAKDAAGNVSAPRTITFTIVKR